MPAAAVIPAPRDNMYVVAVRTPVVGFETWTVATALTSFGCSRCLSTQCSMSETHGIVSRRLARVGVYLRSFILQGSSVAVAMNND